MGQRCDCGMATPSLTWCPVFLLEVGSISSLSLLSDISSKIPLFEFRGSLFSQVSGAFWRVPLTSYFPGLPVSIFSAGPQGFSSFSSPNTRSGYHLPPSPPIHFLSQVLPSLPTCNCFLLPPKWNWGVLTWALQFVDLFELCGLYLWYSELLFWLISTY